jgi:hypothetical protein
MDFTLTDDHRDILPEDAGHAESIPTLRGMAIPILSFSFYAMSLVKPPTIQAASSFESKLLPLFVPASRQATSMQGEVARDLSAFNWQGSILMIEEDYWGHWLPKFCSNRIRSCRSDQVIIITKNRKSQQAWEQACVNMKSRSSIYMHLGSITVSALFVTGLEDKQLPFPKSIRIENIDKSIACRAAQMAMTENPDSTKKSVTFGTIENGTGEVCLGLWSDISDDKLADLSPLLVKRYMRPAYLKAFTFDIEENPELKSIKAAESHPALPSVPESDEIHQLRDEVIFPNRFLFTNPCPFNIDVWEELTLSDQYPNRAFIDSVIKGFRTGFLPWAEGLTRPGWTCGNLPSYKKYFSFVKEQEKKEVIRGAYSTKFRHLLKYMSVSGLGVILQRNKLRLIHDHSSPLGHAVNDMIPSKEKRVVYEGLNDLAKHLRKQHLTGRTPIVWFADIVSAFRNFKLCPEWAIRNALQFEDDDGIYYRIDNGADFGGGSNPRLTCSVFDLVCEISHKSLGVKVILHYVDDFMGSDVERVKVLDPNCDMIKIGMPMDLAKFIKACVTLGIPLSSLKMGWGDDTIITGIEVNGTKGTFSLPFDRIISYVGYLSAFLKKESCSLHDLDKLSGTLNWCLQIVAGGRPFIRAIYSRKRLWINKERSAIRRIGKRIKESIRWWITMLLSNPVRYIYKERWWDSSEADLTILTDASTGYGLGIFIPSLNLAFWHDFTDICDWKKIDGFHINILEMLAVICALRIVTQKRLVVRSEAKILILSDSGVVCDELAKMDSRSEFMLPFLMDVSSLMMVNNWNLRGVHISGFRNVSDGLSRGPTGRRQFKLDWPGASLVEFTPPNPASFGLSLRQE